MATRTNYEEYIADYVVETDKSCSSGSDIDANDFDVESETGSDSDESERADGHDPRRRWGYAKVADSRNVKCSDFYVCELHVF